MRKLTREEIIGKFKAVHGDRYDYSAVEYVNMYTKVCIICPEHGEFMQLPSNHMKGIGCPKCGGNARRTTEEYVSELKARYPNTNITFDKVRYVNNRTMVTLTCPEHGDFERMPTSLNENLECPECQKRRLSERFSSTTDEFVTKARAIHGDWYDYSRVVYSNHTAPVTIICPEHGEFQQTPMTHLAGSGCPKCGSKAMWDKRGRITTEDWIERARLAHGDKYDYSESEYTGANDRIAVICPKHGRFMQHAAAHANGYGCPECAYENSHSRNERELYEFISGVLPNEEVRMGDRRVLYPMELDVYVPSRNMAFEFDGLYWHCEDKVDKDYHIAKTEECAKKGIRLVHIFEDEWLLSNEKTKSRILSVLGIQSRRISASKCKVSEVSSNEAAEFLEANHLQGKCQSSRRYGLYLGNELVSLMTFGNMRKNLNGKHTEGSYEMIRFCNKLNTNVIGGASRLLAHFIKDNKPKTITSYVDRRWSDGNMYRKLGFSHIRNSRPSYFYIVRDRRENRFKYRKDVLIREGYDKEKSEHQIMSERGIRRIYDCGCMVFRMELRN